MAEGIQFNCTCCKKSIEAWSDGNMYYFDEKGRKRYVYHPAKRELIEKCVGNDSDLICLECGKVFRMDLEKVAEPACPKCESKEIADTFRLEGRKCPWCRDGAFRQDPDYFAIS